MPRRSSVATASTELLYEAQRFGDVYETAFENQLLHFREQHL
jgi:hypothetical protein